MIPLTAITDKGFAQLEPGKDPRLEALETAQQFEQIFVQQMLAGMRKTAEMAGEDKLFGQGPGGDTYTQWFDNHLSAHLTNNGGLGIAETLMQDFERWGQIPRAGENLDANA